MRLTPVAERLSQLVERPVVRRARPERHSYTSAEPSETDSLSSVPSPSPM